ncbi:hypothetical protein AK88_02517 [Plasmodium fragile]|uniref:Plasmodium RESA N-terminal domain-containing protein n=1 Tax=Plasmodium fragile TaxID=5857 RepID=A0A0D9QPZ7_PLAFR|nr:uncharacterized protein AK88_02517 [Plasmodium fragile]KJP87761.1 hypothetical protein AK88_02517 [Plasmodium fragile]
MAHANRKTTSTSCSLKGTLQAKTDNASRPIKACSGANEEGETHGKKTHRNFLSKTAAILFVGSAYIFLKHQDDLKTQNIIASTLRRNRNVARNLAMTIEEATPSKDKFQLEDIDCVESEDTGEDVPAAQTRGEAYLDGEDEIQEEEDSDEDWEEEPSKDNTSFLRGEAKVPGPETTQGSDEKVGVKTHDVLADAIYDDVSTVPKSHDALDNDNTKRQGRKQQRMGKGHTIEKYDGKVAEDREKYGIHRSIELHYEINMAHANRKTTSTSCSLKGTLQAKTDNASRPIKACSGANEEGETHGKKTHRNFLSKTAAILFVGSAYIFLKHQDDLKTQNIIASTLRRNRNVARNLAMTIEEATPSKDKFQLEDIDCVESEDTGEDVPAAQTRGEAYLDGEDEIQEEEDSDEDWEEEPSKDNTSFLRGEAKVPGPETTQGSDEKVGVKTHDVLADAIYDDVSTVPKSHDALDNDNTKRQGRKQQRMGKGHTIEKYDGKVAEDREKYGIHRSIELHYEMSCFDERLTDSEINTTLEQMEQEPHTWELLSLYWQSYRNERNTYFALKRYLKEKFLELQKQQTIATIQIYNKKWNKCEDIINNNLTKQHEHVSEVFYTMVAKEKLSTHEFKKILNDFRETWKELIIKTAVECIAVLQEPISLELIYVENDPGVFEMRVPGFMVSLMPYGSKGKLDSKVGAERSSQVLQNEEQGEKAEKKPQESSLEGGAAKQKPEQNNKHPGSPSGESFKEPVVQAKEKAAKDNAESVTGATKVPGPETTQESDEQVEVKRHDILADAIYDDVSTVPKSHDALDNENNKGQMTENKRKQAGHTMEKYEGKVAEDREKYGIHRSIELHYEMSCFDERLTDSEINTKLEQMEQEPHTWELLSLYWQAYTNERGKYFALKKSLQEKFLELQKKQAIATLEIFSKKWRECEEIINNNLTKQHEQVSEVFYTMAAKEKLSTHEFKKILNDFRETWKELIVKTAVECIAVLQEPIALESYTSRMILMPLV